VPPCATAAHDCCPTCQQYLWGAPSSGSPVPLRIWLTSLTTAVAISKPVRQPRSPALGARRQQHWNPRAVRPVVHSVIFHEVAFLEKNSDKYIPRGSDRENEVSDRHVRSRPECDYKA